MKPKENSDKLNSAIAELELMDITIAGKHMVIEAAARIARYIWFDAHNIHVMVFHNGTRFDPWMFEIRRNGLLRGSFEGVKNVYETREEAETQAFEVGDSMLDGTFEIRFTS
jgi:hypothetical protein